MATDLPPELRELAEAQCGILARRQIVEAGLTADIVSSRLKRGSWQRVYPGVYAVFAGHLSRSAALWAAVLYAGPGAMLSHQSAAELWGLTEQRHSLIHITVPASRRITAQPGIVVHVSKRAEAALHPAASPPRTRVEDTVIDHWDSEAQLDDAVGGVTRALGERLTTLDKLRAAARARGRVQHRKLLDELLSPDYAGIHSVLEWRYDRNVARPHGLPPVRRQVKVRRGGHNEYRDALYEDYQTVVELDGRAHHPTAARWRDIRRDNAAVAEGKVTLRYGWLDVTASPCQVAAELARVLRHRGYTGARPCSPDCPVGRVTRDESGGAADPGLGPEPGLAARSSRAVEHRPSIRRGPGGRATRSSRQRGPEMARPRRYKHQPAECDTVER